MLRYEMINSFLKVGQCISRRAHGAATLIMTVILIVVSTLIIIFAANFSMMWEKSTSNINENSQAFAAADAGVEFAINYLKKNAATILASPVSGFIAPYSDGSTTNVTFANNSKFSVVYTNPVANNYNLIQIKSTGVSNNSASTRVIYQWVQFGSVILSPGNAPLVTQGNVTMSGNADITNTQYNTNIVSGGSVSLSGSSTTTLSSGVSSNAGSIKSDVQSNNTILQNMSQADFFSTYFGNNSAAVKSAMVNVYSNTTSTNYSSTLAGKSGTSIWIDQTGGTATINGNTTIGSASNPVLIVVNGDLSLSGSVTIYGYIFVFGTNTIDSISGNVQIIGGLAAAGDLTMAGSSTLSYSASTLNNLQKLPVLSYYAKVPGTWRDF